MRPSWWTFSSPLGKVLLLLLLLLSVVVVVVVIVLIVTSVHTPLPPTLSLCSSGFLHSYHFFRDEKKRTRIGKSSWLQNLKFISQMILRRFIR